MKIRSSLPKIDYTPAKVDIWYDRSARVWTAYVVNAAGDQISDAQHSHDKAGIPTEIEAYRLHG